LKIKLKHNPSVEALLCSKVEPAFNIDRSRQSWPF
jgi:hypothetical protein